MWRNGRRAPLKTEYPKGCASSTLAAGIMKEKKYSYYDCRIWENGRFVASYLKWANSKKQAVKFALNTARDYGNGYDGYLLVEVYKVKKKYLYSEHTIEQAGYNQGAKPVD